MGNLKFTIDDTCVKCGACAEDCPVQCITEGMTRFNIGTGCIGCGDEIGRLERVIVRKR